VKICVLSHWGEGAWFAWLMKQAGHDVHFSVEAEPNRGVLAGLIEQTEITDPTDYDLMVFDTTGFGSLSDESHTKTPTLGDSSFADQLEHDRLFGIEFMQRAGIKVPTYEHFNDVSAALRFIRKTKKVYVFKPCGEGADTAATYVSKSAEDLERYIDVLWRSAPVKEFILQEVVKGTEVSTEMWMNESGYYFLNHTLECKKLMNGDLGPATGCSGNLVFAIEQENPIFNQGLRKAFEPLREAGYVGMIDLNAIVTDGELFGLEWTPRFGYEGTCNVASLLPMDFAEFMYRIAANQKLPDLAPRHSFCASIRLSIPPYPNDGLPKKFYKQGVPIEGMNRKLLTSFYALDMRLNETNEDLFETAGINGWLGAALGCGETIGQAFEHAQGVIDSIRVPDLMYRTDVRSVAAKRYVELERNGWLRPTWGD
jgi:phosphoribosylamine-glycine ligase